jgi:hypothetical protein
VSRNLPNGCARIVCIAPSKPRALLLLKGQRRIAEQATHRAQSNSLGDVADLTQPRHGLLGGWRQRRAVGLLTETMP